MPQSDLASPAFLAPQTQPLLLGALAECGFLPIDLIENFEAGKLPGILRWMGWLGGVLDPDGKTPLDLRMTFSKSAARTSLASMLAWHPQRVILAHARCYLAQGELKRAFRWLD